MNIFKPLLKKAKSVPSVGKVMATVLLGESWNCINGLSRKSNNMGIVNGQAEYRKTTVLEEKGILFHQHKAPALISLIAMAKIYELRYEVIGHPSYLPDLTSSDYFLFLRLKVSLGEIFIELGGHNIRKSLFCKTRCQLLIGWIKEMGA